MPFGGGVGVLDSQDYTVAKEVSNVDAEPPVTSETPLIKAFRVDEETVSILAEKGITHFTPIQA